jgi:hypothetical protein
MGMATPMPIFALSDRPRLLEDPLVGLKASPVAVGIAFDTELPVELDDGEVLAVIGCPSRDKIW